MFSAEQLQTMTVSELRKYAKEQALSLGGASTKAAIIQRLLEANSPQQTLPADDLDAAPQEWTQPAPAAAAPERPSVRRAMIITDDGEDAPLPAAAVERPRPQAAAPAPLTVPVQANAAAPAKSNKPAFTLQGARAWHNPHPFTPNQQGTPKYAAPALSSPFAYGPKTGGDASGVQYRQGLPRVTRFGPEANSLQTKPADIQQDSIGTRPQVFRAASVPQGLRRAPAAAQAEFGPGAYVLRAAETGFDAPAGRTPYGVPKPRGGEYAPELPVEAPAYRAREAAPSLREPAGLNPAVPEMLATGDCGDGAGVLEVHAEGYGFLRAGNYLPGRSDVYVSNAQIRRFHLRSGDFVEGKTRPQRENDRYAAMLYITRINGVEAEDVGTRRDFDELTPTYPTARINLSSQEENDMVLRLIDLFSPIGYGQRAMIVAAPKAGKTTILKKIALAIKRQHSDLHLMMLLVDERPEEVTDLKETVGGDILYSTFDEPAESHVRVSELVLERAMRLVENGKNVVILMDSLTRLSRAYNTLAPTSARVMSGGLAAGALNKPKRFFGAARNLKEGGSLTIIATALIETGSRMDEVIFEEFKGTGNMELTLDRQLSEMRVFPAISIARSGTRHDELLLNKDEQRVTNKVRNMVSGSSEQEGITLLLSMMDKTRDNADFVARFDDWIQMMRGYGANDNERGRANR